MPFTICDDSGDQLVMDVNKILHTVKLMSCIVATLYINQWLAVIREQLYLEKKPSNPCDNVVVGIIKAYPQYYPVVGQNC